MEITTMAQAMQLHGQLLKSGDPKSQPRALSKLFTFSALSPSGDLAYARHILNSLRTSNSYYYNTMIRAYAQSSNPVEAVDIFLAMRESLLLAAPDKFTYPFLFKACARLGLFRLGLQIYGLVHKLGFSSDLYVQHGFIRMCCMCGQSGVAYEVFERMLERDVVSWTSMIDGFVEDGRPLDAIRLFDRMLEAGVEPNDITIVAVLGACSEVGALGMGKKVHELVERKGFGFGDNISTALIDMYAKCGCLESARRVFDGIVEKNNVILWTAMICSLGSHGKGRDAIDLFEQMLKFDVRPDERTMTSLLSACRNAGLVKESLGYMKDMEKVYGIRPALQHYGCLVDLLARAGHLDDAEELIRMTPFEPDDVIWRTFVWACKVHGDVERAECFIDRLKLRKVSDCGSYVLLGNLYASTGRWADKASVRHIMRENGIVKPPASSMIEIDGVVYEFAAGDSSHFEAKEIFGKLVEIAEKLKKEGYQPKLSEVLLEIEEEEKAFQLIHHSEKLAIAFAMIKISPGTQIRILKNLRSCEDCHSFMKLISKVYQRDIIVRDRIRFHHFSEGKCSCGDHW
uniref:DYW domain-containing protein n=1 Tax=Kalanchoe fedtschenkoi TaxID=63787 RepID=A0A7N0T263_KALFE